MKLTRDQKTLQDITGLIEYAFKKKTPIIDDPLFLSRYAHADAYGVYQEQELTNLVMANHFESQIFQEKVKMAGVGYVASYPEYRGKGGISSIMPEMLLDLYQQGVAVSQLAPFSEDFYRQFGYESTSWQKTYQLSNQAFNYLTSEKQGRIKRGTWQQMKAFIQVIYQQVLSQNQVGTVVREDWWWDRLDAYYPHRFYAVAFDETGEAKGYMIYRMEGQTFVVDEFIYLNQFALQKLLTFLKSHVSSFEDFLYHAPVHEMIEKVFREQNNITITLRPYMMSRIIDIQQLLSHIPLVEKETIIEVTQDKECPWNVGSWSVSQDHCQRVEQVGDIQASIQVFSELLLGELTLAEGIFLGKVITTKEIKTEVFSKGRKSFYDYF